MELGGLEGAFMELGGWRGRLWSWGVGGGVYGVGGLEGAFMELGVWVIYRVGKLK